MKLTSKIPENYSGPVYTMQICVNEADGHHHIRLVFIEQTAVTDAIQVLTKAMSLPTFERAITDYFETADEARANW